MKTSWLTNTSVLAALMCYHLVRSIPVSQHLVNKRQAEFGDLSQSQQAQLWDEGFQDDELSVAESDRDKRKIHEAKWGVKNAVLGLVFGKPSYNNQPTTTKGPTTTDDTPDFDRKKVSLVIPDELFGSSFMLVTNLSKIVGDVIMGTAQRTQRIAEGFRPIFGKVLSFKGVDVKTPPANNSIK